ncbi:hypothetical protein LIA77_00012 [Sarocladium implicatum]|nr:hypothetical protein LIA77_00012 [Sarocladium implicatum]
MLSTTRTVFGAALRSPAIGPTRGRSFASTKRFFMPGDRYSTKASDNDAEGIDADEPPALIDQRTNGRTGGGESLESTAFGAPSKPRVFNSSMPSDGRPVDLDKEQKREVDQHNREFDKTSEPGQKIEDGRDTDTSHGALSKS